MKHPPLPAQDEIHLWLLEHRTGSPSFLSKEELARLKNFRFESDQERYRYTQSAKRTILAHYLEQKPLALSFVENKYGKPSLAGLEFSISHTKGLSILAVSTGSPLGIDIERLEPQANLENLAQRILSNKEILVFTNLSNSKKLAAFYQFWTAKEAYLKAIGTGFQIEPQKVEAEPAFTSAACSVSTKQELMPVSCGKEFVCHLARKNRPTKLSQFIFEFDSA